MRLLATVIAILWCLGILMGEGVSQAAAGLALAVVLVRLAWHRPQGEVWIVGKAAVAFALWQAVSPLVARLTGAADAWPRSGRWTQALDTLAPPVLATLLSTGLVWWLVGAVLAVGWIASSAAGVYQHLVWWPHGMFPWTKTPEWRLHQNFGTDENPRYGSYGFLFHRLRFAHAAVAMLGPALVATMERRGVVVKIAAALVTSALLVATWTSFARAALLAGAFACGVAVLATGTKRTRIAALVLGGGGLFVLTLGFAFGSVSGAWANRLVDGVRNLTEGDRAVAMSAGLRVALSHPLLGAGFGNHKPAALAFQGETGVTELLANDAHNIWLTVWAETGLVGLLLGLRYHWLLGRALFRRWRLGAWLSGGALLSLLAFHVLGLVHYLPFHSSVALTFAFVWGLGLAAPLPVKAPTSASEPTTANETDVSETERILPHAVVDPPDQAPVV